MENIRTFYRVNGKVLWWVGDFAWIVLNGEVGLAFVHFQDKSTYIWKFNSPMSLPVRIYEMAKALGVKWVIVASHSTGFKHFMAPIEAFAHAPSGQLRDDYEPQIFLPREQWTVIGSFKRLVGAPTRDEVIDHIWPELEQAA